MSRSRSWEQHNYDFRRSHRTVRSLLTPAAIDEEYDPDLNGCIDADTQAIRLLLTDEGRQEYADTDLRKDFDPWWQAPLDHRSGWQDLRARVHIRAAVEQA